MQRNRFDVLQSQCLLYNKLWRNRAGHSAGIFTCQQDFSERVVRKNCTWNSHLRRERKGEFIYLVSSCLSFLVVRGWSCGLWTPLHSQTASSRPSVAAQDGRSHALRYDILSKSWMKHQLRGWVGTGWWLQVFEKVQIWVSIHLMSFFPQHYCSPPLSKVSLPRFQLPVVNHSTAADNPSSDVSSVHYQPNTMSQCLCSSPHFISSHRNLIVFHHHKNSKHSAMRYFEREHIHINFITVYGYNCSIVLLVIVSLTVPNLEIKLYLRQLYVGKYSTDGP